MSEPQALTYAPRDQIRTEPGVDPHCDRRDSPCCS